MNICIHSNINRDIDFRLARKISNYLEKKDVNVIKLFEDKNLKENINKDIDFAIVIGGDGTILNFVQNYYRSNIKILGINTGTLGYLTDTDSEDALDSIENILNNDYTIDSRIMLKCKYKDKERIAFNDLYINKVSNTKMVEVNVDVNKTTLENFRGDGVIISTPTGSTAYNLSAGGPILKPNGNMLAITPVCPHMLYARPIIVDSDDNIDLSVNIDERQKAMIYVDGTPFSYIIRGETVSITKSENTVRLIKTKDKNFYNILKDKMLTQKLV